MMPNIGNENLRSFLGEITGYFQTLSRGPPISANRNFRFYFTLMFPAELGEKERERKQKGARAVREICIHGHTVREADVVKQKLLS